MGIILNANKPLKLSGSENKNKKIVLTGGCFDILHAGHIEFLTRAKKLGDTLIVLLESDEKISKLKGKGRPINSQTDRAAVLSNLSMVDVVICLPNLKSNLEYEALVKMLQPDIIATTAEDNLFSWEKNYTKEAGAKIVKVMRKKKSYSTSDIINRISTKGL